VQNQGAQNQEGQNQPLMGALANWLRTPVGQYVSTWERKTVNRMVANVFGYHAVQLGLPQQDFLQSNRIQTKILVHPCLPDGLRNGGHCPQPAARDVAVLVAEPEQLPFDSQSLDLLILPHVLECSNHPHQVLREASRVLVPEGRVVICGFNPWSLWGLHERLPGLEPLLPVPAPMQVSLARVKDWFTLLSFEADRGHFGCYAPPCSTQNWLQRFAFMESAGNRWWPVCGAVYVISAVHRVAGMRLMAPGWKTREVRRASRQAAAATCETVSRVNTGGEKTRNSNVRNNKADA